MTAFVITSAALILLVLGFVLRPLWRSKPLIGGAMLVALAVTTALTYTQIGTPQALDPAQRRAPDSLADAVAQLEAELARNPAQAEGWRLLARAYTAEGRVGDARDAYAKAAKLAPDEPDVLAEAAEARALAAADRRFDEQAVALLQHALTKQPMHQRARWFLGIAQRQAKQPAEAAKTWEPLLAIVDAKTATSLREQINNARTEAGLPPLPAVAAAADTATASLNITVELTPALQAKLTPNDVLFVLARKPGGPPMPLAVKRLPATGFPITVELTDSDSPMPTMKLSQAGDVELVARISRQGVANRAAGDLESMPQQAKVESGTTYQLRIDHVVE